MLRYGALFNVLLALGKSDLTYYHTLQDNANGVLWVGYPGQSGGQALAEILFGMVNPSGRLPNTIVSKMINQ